MIMKFITTLKLSSVGLDNCPFKGNRVSVVIVFCRPHNYNLSELSAVGRLEMFIWIGSYI